MAFTKLDKTTSGVHTSSRDARTEVDAFSGVELEKDLKGRLMSI